MPVEWKATADALDALMARVTQAGKRIESQGGKLVQSAVMLRAPRGPTGRLRGGITIGVYRGHLAVGPTGPYARRESLGFHGRDIKGRVYAQRGNPYFRSAVADVAPLVRVLAVREWRKAVT